jgi:drug/metabolite transporter (DMT)-like permease
MSWQLLLALAVSALCAASGQIMLKMGADGRETPAAFLNAYVLAGLGLYGLGTAIWIFALSRLPLNVVYPFSMLTLALVMVMAHVVLGERPNATVLTGWAIVIAGVGVVAVGSQT